MESCFSLSAIKEDTSSDSHGFFSLVRGLQRMAEYLFFWHFDILLNGEFLV